MSGRVDFNRNRPPKAQVGEYDKAFRSSLTLSQQKIIARGFMACAKRLGKSVAELGREAGVHPNVIYNVVEGHARMSSSTIKKIAVCLAKNRRFKK